MELKIDQALQKAVEAHKAGKLQDAKSLYRAILQTHPNHSDANHNLGVLALQVKQPAASLPHFKAALEAKPNQGQYWLSYIDALIHVGQTDDARQVLEQGRQGGLQGEAVEALAGRLDHLENATPGQSTELELAIAHREAGCYKEAARVLQSYLASHPQDASAHALLAQVLSIDKLDEPAWAAIKIALSIDLALPIVQLNHARLLLKQQKPVEALQAAQMAYQSDDTDPENQLVLATMLGANNQNEQAFRLVTNALQIRPNYSEAFANRALLKLRGNDLAGALIDVEKALSIKPHLMQLWGMVGLLRHQFKNLPGAIEALEKALDYEPDNVGHLVNLGEFKRQAGALEAAIVLLEKATAIAPDNAGAWVNLGTALQASKRIPEAKAVYAKALEIAPEQAEVASNLGALVMKEENWAEALRYFNQALVHQPTRVAILTNRAAALNALERYDEAKQAARHAIETEPAHTEAHLAMSGALIGQKYYEAAQAVLDAVKRPEPDDRDNTHRLALSYTALFRAQERWAEAQAWVRRALAVKPKEVKVLRQLGAILDEQKHYDDAWVVLQEALENSPEDEVTLQAMASHYARQERWAEAQAWVRRALAVKPKEVKVLRQLGAILDEQKHYDDAWVVLQEALENSPEDEVTLQAMASHYARQERWAEAEAWVRRALAVKPVFAEAHNALGSILQNLGRPDEAEVSYRRALEIEPDSAKAYYYLGITLKYLGRLEEAIASCRKALEIKPDYAEAYNDLGNTLSNSGNTDEAVTCYRKALECKPNFALAYFHFHPLLLDSDDMTPAIKCMEKAVEIDPSDVKYRFFLAMLLDYSGNVEDAAEHFDWVEKSANLPRAWLDAWRYLKSSNNKLPLITGSNIQSFRIGIDSAINDGLIMEFGVRFGTTIRQIAALVNQEVHGFDSFEGLPEQWHNEPKGSYSTKRVIPTVPDNVYLYAGWFEDTLPEFLKNHTGPVRFMNIDCDIYSSTKTVLDLLADRIFPGTVIVFDEYIGNEHWREDEFKAFQEAVTKYCWNYEYICFSFFTKQVVIRIT